MIKFDITPIGKPRMTRSDAWRKRKCVTDYWKYKDKLVKLSKKHSYKVTGELKIDFVIPFPKSYSKKKCEALLDMPHLLKPDLDNMIKAFQDCLAKDDSHIWFIEAKKYWGYKGEIIIYE